MNGMLQGMGKNTPVGGNQRALLERRYNSARINLLLMIVLTAINAAIYFTDVNISFLFSASVPIYSLLYGYLFESYGVSGALTVGIAVAVVTLALYLLCWFLSKKKRGWMTAALVLFVIDCAALGFVMWDLIPANSDLNVGTFLVEILFHIWILVTLILGVVAAAKLKKLPEQTPQSEAAEAQQIWGTQQPQQTDGAAQELFGTRQAQEQGAENTENGVWEQPQDAAQDPYAQTPTDDPWQKNE